MKHDRRQAAPPLGGMVGVNDLIKATKERFDEEADIDGDGVCEFHQHGYSHEITVMGRVFHVRIYDDSPSDAIVGTARPDTTSRRLRLLIDYLTGPLGCSTVKFHSQRPGTQGRYRAIDINTLEFLDL